MAVATRRRMPTMRAAILRIFPPTAYSSPLPARVRQAVRKALAFERLFSPRIVPSLSLEDEIDPQACSARDHRTGTREGAPRLQSKEWRNGGSLLHARLQCKRQR